MLKSLFYLTMKRIHLYSFDNHRDSLTAADAQGSDAVFAAPAVQFFDQRINDAGSANTASRSEEHTSELQSRANLVCRLLLDNKKQTPDNRLTPHSPRPV